MKSMSVIGFSPKSETSKIRKTIKQVNKKQTSESWTFENL